MKVKLPTKTLKDALSRVANIPGAHGASVHTQAVKLTCDLAGLTLMRFTSEAKISVTVDEHVDADESKDEPSVNHAALTSLVNACNADEVLITSDAKTLNLASGKAKWRLKVFDEDIMIDPPEPELETEHVNILLEDLTELLSFTLPASSKDPAGSPAFCGVNLSNRETGLYFTATDYKRCFMAIAPYHLDVNCTIPNEGVAAIIKALAGTKGAGTLSIGDTFVTVSSANLEISTALLSDPYPQAVATLIEKSEPSIESKILVNRDELADALDACATVNEGDRIVNMKIVGKVMEVSGTNQRDTDGAITLDCDATAPLHVGVPGSDMASAFRKLKVEKGMLEVAKTKTAMYVKQAERIAFFALAPPK